MHDGHPEGHHPDYAEIAALEQQLGIGDPDPERLPAPDPGRGAPEPFGPPGDYDRWRAQAWTADELAGNGGLWTLTERTTAPEHISFRCRAYEGRGHEPCSGGCDGHGTGDECAYPCECACHVAPGLEPYPDDAPWPGAPLAPAARTTPPRPVAPPRLADPRPAGRCVSCGARWPEGARVCRACQSERWREDD